MDSLSSYAVVTLQMDYQKRHCIKAALDDNREIHVDAHVYKWQCNPVLNENILRQLKLMSCTNNTVVNLYV
jgi:hypothetical protein